MGKYYAVMPNDEYLAHYGVKGMKWGKHKAKELYRVVFKKGLGAKTPGKYSIKQIVTGELRKKSGVGDKVSRNVRSASYTTGWGLAEGMAKTYGNTRAYLKEARAYKTKGDKHSGLIRKASGEAYRTAQSTQNAYEKYAKTHPEKERQKDHYFYRGANVLGWGYGTGPEYKPLKTKYSDEQKRRRRQH